MKEHENLIETIAAAIIEEVLQQKGMKTQGAIATGYLDPKEMKIGGIDVRALAKAAIRVMPSEGYQRIIS